MGAFSLGAGSLGIWAYGGMAIGWQVFCGFGLAWHSATGGIVAAHDFALRGVARASQANTEIANQFFQRDLFSRISKIVASHGLLMMLLLVIPVSLQARIIGQARRRRESANP